MMYLLLLVKTLRKVMMGRRSRKKAGKTSAMGATVTCKTCGKSWEDRPAYLHDEVKCGKNDVCPLLTSSTRRKQMWPYKDVPTRTAITTVTYGTVPDPLAKEIYIKRIFQEVPKVIITETAWSKA